MSSLKQSVANLQLNQETNFLVLTNLETDQKIGSSKIYYKDIPNGDLAGYIKSEIGNTQHDTLVWVEHRKDIGTSNRKDDKEPSYKITVAATAPIEKTIPEPTPRTEQTHVPPTVNHTSFLGNPAGLGLAEVVKMNVDSMRLDDLRKLNEDYKEEIRSLKQNNGILAIENRQLEAKAATSEAREQMAVMMAKLENKGFLDSDAFTKLIEKAPSLLAAYKGGAMPESAAMLGAAEVSEPVQEVIDYIAENCDDMQANFLGSVCAFIGNSNFISELQTLILKYKTNGTV